jgi:hypothetical protein
LDQGRLSTRVGTDDADDLTCIYPQVETMEDAAASEGLIELFNDDAHGFSPSLSL